MKKIALANMPNLPSCYSLVWVMNEGSLRTLKYCQKRAKVKVFQPFLPRSLTKSVRKNEGGGLIQCRSSLKNWLKAVDEMREYNRGS